MKRTIIFVALIICLGIPSIVSAQIVDSTVCDILANPQGFDGKIVRIKGVVIAGFEEFAIKGSGCNQLVNAIWLAYPEGTEGKAGPVVSLQLQFGKNNAATVPDVRRTSITLDKNKDFKNFDNLLSTPAKTAGLCLGCVKFTVSATLVGRLDGAQSTGLSRDSAGAVIGIGGFGNLNRYPARLVLQSVSDISSQEIDYEKGETALSGGKALPEGAFVPEAPNAGQMKRGLDAFGARGEDNGVIVEFGVADEILKDNSAKSDARLIFQAIFDGRRLKGPALQIAISHVGTHIADIRSTTPAIRDLSFYGAEFRALQTSVLNAVAAQVKALTLPGGYAIYNQSWSNSDLSKNANGGISGFLTNWSGITNPRKL